MNIAIAAISFVLLFVFWDLFHNGKWYWCKWRHHKKHQRQPCGYGSNYEVWCDKCRHGWVEHRN